PREVPAMTMLRLLAAIPLAACAGAVAAPTISGCPALPADNIWNARVDTLPVHASSATWVSTIGSTRAFHMDFGSGLYPYPPDPTAAPIGIPFVVVAGTQAKVPVTFDYADESDPAPYPIPPSAPLPAVGPAHADGDRHALLLHYANSILHDSLHSPPQHCSA